MAVMQCLGCSGSPSPRWQLILDVPQPLFTFIGPGGSPFGHFRCASTFIDFLGGMAYGFFLMEGVFFGVPFEVLSLFELVSSRMSEATVSISSNSCRPMQQAPAPVVLRASDLGKQVMTGWDIQGYLRGRSLGGAKI